MGGARKVYGVPPAGVPTILCHAGVRTDSCSSASCSWMMGSMPPANDFGALSLELGPVKTRLYNWQSGAEVEPEFFQFHGSILP